MDCKLSDIKGIIFDYGGTLDTNGKHWSEVLWGQYVKLNVPVSKQEFKDAYVHGERMLALKPLIKPDHNFYDVLFIKVGLQLLFLKDKSGLNATDSELLYYQKEIAGRCYSGVKNTIKTSREVLNKLCEQHNLILVSNFYGNINEILEDFGLLCFFKKVIESSVVGVRKPDPAIFTYGVDALECRPDETVVVGDSFSKDILPAQKAGCKTIWLKGEGWGEDTDDSVPDFLITDLRQLTSLFQIEE